MYDNIKNVVPTTQSVHLTEGGSNWLSAVIQIKKRLEGEPKNALGDIHRLSLAQDGNSGR